MPARVGCVQPTCNTTPESNRRSQRGQLVRAPESTESWSNQRSQRQAENVDTVGVTGSIPVSPT